MADLKHEYLFLYENGETKGSVNPSRNLQATINKNQHLNSVHFKIETKEYATVTEHAKNENVGIGFDKDGVQ